MSGPSDRSSEVTRLVNSVGQGGPEATDALFPLVYDELRRLAQQQLAAERPGHTLQATALVHEAYLKLVGPDGPAWENRRHFFLAAARAIRRILIDHARTRDRDKRGGGAQVKTLLENDATTPGLDLDVFALDDALARLSEEDRQIAEVVELRFFAGLSVEETALAMGTSARTIARHWQFARVWLNRALSDGD
ncbi:MAG: sigma-70 family RNA polymerase sigma factor [Phycisphaerales bacterium]|nr:sigma-70 family RNA polymerase sigma factor [Phycisphaerales bacterium]MCB9862518.1 sigma-70 family RNA polymerase sigma factor [Phycisphaerales bacterium]